MTWKQYPAYKEAGIEWLGEIPGHWQTQAIWMLFKLGRGRVISHEEICDHPGEYPVYSSQTENDGILGLTDTYDFDGDYLTWTTDGAKAGTVFERHGRFNCTNVCGTLSAKDQECVIGFFRYAIDQATHWFVRHDINPKLMNNVMASIRIPTPHYKEQRAIAVFLDRETERIDTLIAKKERQIELLQEKRAALISQAVTKGLNPNAKMKDSGIEWLGQVPEHWDVKRIRFLIEGGLANGLFKKKEFFGSGVKLINVFDVYREDFVVNQESLERVEANEVEQEKYAIWSGDIFFVRSSLKLEGVGRSVCVMNITEPSVFECHVVRARPVQEIINPTFLIHFLNSIRAINRLISLANLVTMATIDQDRIKSLEVPLPPRNEQDEIMVVLNREIKAIEKLQIKIAESIEKLHEYRTTLISAAVTGKIDIRDKAVG